MRLGLDLLLLLVLLIVLFGLSIRPISKFLKALEFINIFYLLFWLLLIIFFLFKYKVFIGLLFWLVFYGRPNWFCVFSIEIFKRWVKIYRWSLTLSLLILFYLWFRFRWLLSFLFLDFISLWLHIMSPLKLRKASWLIIFLFRLRLVLSLKRPFYILLSAKIIFLLALWFCLLKSIFA